MGYPSRAFLFYNYFFSSGLCIERCFLYILHYMYALHGKMERRLYEDILKNVLKLSKKFNIIEMVAPEIMVKK